MTDRDRLVFVVASAPSVVMALGLLVWMAARAALHLPLWPEGAGLVLPPIFGAVPILSVVAALALRGQGRRRS